MLMLEQSVLRGRSGLADIQRMEFIVKFLKQISLPKRMNDVFELLNPYCNMSYRSFHRYIEEYAERQIVSIQKVPGGAEGKYTIINEVR